MIWIVTNLQFDHIGLSIHFQEKQILIKYIIWTACKKHGQIHEMYMQISADYGGSEETEHWRCDLSEFWRQINLQLALNEHPRHADRTGIRGQSAHGVHPDYVSATGTLWI